jgi:glucose-6-phosphate isomerase
MVKIDISTTKDFVTEIEFQNYGQIIKKCFSDLTEKKGKGNEFLGWITLPDEINDNFLNDIETEAKRISEISEIFVVVGIGGSYLGARAVIEALNSYFEIDNTSNKKIPKIVFAGNNISEEYHAQLLKFLDKKDYSLTVISKSGTTTEPAIAFRLLKNHLENKYGKEEARKRIIAITDKQKGALKKLAEKEGYKTYIVPDDVGGRYSVLTPVGLLPIAVAGFDIKKLVEGAKEMKKYIFENEDTDKNPAYQYAITRNLLYNKGKTTEIMVTYEPKLFYLSEWWKQLYGESEGKENKGIYPSSVEFTTDLHSMGQYIQEGLRNIFESVLIIDNFDTILKVPHNDDNSDELNYIAGKRMSEVNKMAELGTTLAHLDGGVPIIRIIIDKLNEFSLGELIYFYEFACGLSGYLLGINPFDQPGVEAYKKNMFALLEKPGYEKESQEIKKRL